MSCVNMRDQLAEHALGVLQENEADDVERHLDECAGCRREWEELREGAAEVAMSLPAVEPSRALEERIVKDVSEAGRGARKLPGRRGRSSGRSSVPRLVVRTLVAATMAAVLVAVGAVGWAVKERNRAADITQIAISRLNDIKKVERIIASTGGRPFHAQLLPPGGEGTWGQAIIVSSATPNNFIFVDILPPMEDTGPYTVQLVDRRGPVVPVGQLDVGTNGDLVLYQTPSRDLSQIIAVSVLDRHSLTILTGDVRPFATP